MDIEKRCETCGQRLYTPHRGNPFEPDRSIKSSVVEIDNFLDSNLYQDFIAELFIRSEHPRMVLLDERLEFSGRYYDMARGGLEAFRVIQGVFEDLKNNKETQIKEGEQNV